MVPFGFGCITSTICPRTWKESHPLVYCVIDIQNLSLLWTLKWPVNWLQPTWLPSRSPWRSAHQSWSNCRFWKGPVTGLQPIQPQSVKNFVGTGTWQKTIPSLSLDILKGSAVGSSPLEASVYQLFWGSRIPVGDALVSNLRDSETALYFVPAYSQLHLQAGPPAQGLRGRHFHLHPQRFWKGSILASSLSSHGQGAVQPTQGHTHSCLQSQVFRPQSWLWRLKQAWGLVSAPLSHNLGSVSSTQELIQWPGRSTPKDLVGAHLFMHAIKAQLTEDPNVGSEVGHFPSATLLNKVLEIVSSTLGPDMIHSHPCPW